MGRSNSTYYGLPRAFSQFGDHTARQSLGVGQTGSLFAVRSVLSPRAVFSARLLNVCCRRERAPTATIRSSFYPNASITLVIAGCARFLTFTTVLLPAC